MKWAYYVQYKLKAAIALTVIMILILLSNFLERKSFSNLDLSMTSIYQDRLKPSAYLYEISNNLYQKRLLHDGNRNLRHNEIETNILKYNNAIISLIGAYEQTSLTKEENRQWILFKQHLAVYNTMEQRWVASYNANQSNDNLYLLITGQFDKTMSSLHSLNNIQVGEGNNLQKSSHSIVSHTLMLSYLEIALLIVLGLFTLIILSTTDKTLFAGRGNEALN